MDRYFDQNLTTKERSENLIRFYYDGAKPGRDGSEELKGNFLNATSLVEIDMSFGTEWDIRPESTSGYCGSLNGDSDYTEETFIAFKEEERAKILKDGPAKAIRDDMFSQSAKVLERMSGKEEIKTKKEIGR